MYLLRVLESVWCRSGRSCSLVSIHRGLAATILFPPTTKSDETLDFGRWCRVARVLDLLREREPRTRCCGGFGGASRGRTAFAGVCSS
ncbi:hypothetical protein NDU88_002034 [Pleurodeles waltl]|uniref:Secreted protein n=1 Tax=Pleurodeles waltl TaxID=8319 RepID=A0AAV7LN73_PLEWA|nr:hypothetical protein NDU88_002034 [Pleurodeles waltl]